MAKRKGDGKAPTKANVVSGELAIEYVPIDSIKPNSYNPNRQSDHDFELLCRSISEDGFTQPVIVQRKTREIVDGEHRWRAGRHLGFTEVPITFTDMTPEQARIATLRHNRARGSEDPALAGAVLRQIAELGGLENAADSLMLDDVELERLLGDMGDADEAAGAAVEVSADQLGPAGKGLSDVDRARGVDRAADVLRAKEKLIEEAKRVEERDMAKADGTFRLVLFFTGAEAEVVRAVLDPGPGPAKNLLEMCRAGA